MGRAQPDGAFVSTPSVAPTAAQAAQDAAATRAAAEVCSASAAPHQPGQRLGRFRLLAVLGRGARAVVWRALDERLQRDVALKLMPAAGAAGQGSGWLDEARAVGRLAHPHVVPLFEVDHCDGQPLLVFELVEGGTLAALAHRRGALPAREAVALMLGVVDALRAAHALGIVHGDLKPSNILIDGQGSARVMDFGNGCGPGGSPRHRAPETAIGLPVTPQADVFSAGLLLGELIAGAPLRCTGDPRSARGQRSDEPVLPADAAIDDRLRAVLQRAMASDPARRYDGAASLRDALLQWLQPPEDLPQGASAGVGQGTLEFLLHRMRLKSDFPALSERVLRIQRMANSDTESLHRLASEIMLDVALTHKLLRLVNSAHFRRDRQGVASVSRAVALVGLAGIRNLALSLVLVEHMKDKAHAQRLKQAFLRALLAGQLAQQLAHGLARDLVCAPRDAEDAFLGAMFHNLGPLLAEYYFPDEADAVRSELARLARDAGAAVPCADAAPTPDAQVERVAARVLGLGYEALGIGVARHWGLPDSLQRCMRRQDGPPPTRPVAACDRLPWLAVAANEVADAVWSADDAALPQRLDAVVRRHGRGLGFDGVDLRRATDDARRALLQMAPAMGLSLPPGQAALLLAGVPGDSSPGPGKGGGGATDAAAGEGDGSGSGEAARQRSERSSAMLSAGIQHVTDALAGDTVELNQVLRMVLETIHGALGCQRVLFCLRDAGKLQLQARFGLGHQVEALTSLFKVTLVPAPEGPPDLFAAVCLKGGDTLVPDCREPAIAALLPGWHRRQFNARSLLLLPVLMRTAPFALIYADHAQAMPLTETERALLRTLRNQALMAFRQAGQG